MADIIRILRVIEYVGDRAAVEQHMKLVLQGEKTFEVWGNGNHGTRGLQGHMTVKASTLGVVPETVKELKLP